MGGGGGGDGQCCPQSTPNSTHIAAYDGNRTDDIVSVCVCVCVYSVKLVRYAAMRRGVDLTVSLSLKCRHLFLSSPLSPTHTHTHNL